MTKVPKQEQKLEQILIEQQTLEAQELNALVGKQIIFQSISGKHRVTANLDKIGEHYLFMKNISYLVEFSINDYLSGSYSISDNIKATRDYGIFNKADITSIHLINE